MVAALVLLGEGLRLGLMKISDMCAAQHVQDSALPPFICIPVQQLLKVLQFSYKCLMTIAMSRNMASSAEPAGAQRAGKAPSASESIQISRGTFPTP